LGTTTEARKEGSVSDKALYYTFMAALLFGTSLPAYRVRLGTWKYCLVLSSVLFVFNIVIIFIIIILKKLFYKKYF
jgi:hypothetical protein